MGLADDLERVADRCIDHEHDRCALLAKGALSLPGYLAAAEFLGWPTWWYESTGLVAARRLREAAKKARGQMNKEDARDRFLGLATRAGATCPVKATFVVGFLSGLSSAFHAAALLATAGSTLSAILSELKGAADEALEIHVKSERADG